MELVFPRRKENASDCILMAPSVVFAFAWCREPVSSGGLERGCSPTFAASRLKCFCTRAKAFLHFQLRPTAWQLCETKRVVLRSLTCAGPAIASGVRHTRAITRQYPCGFDANWLKRVKLCRRCCARACGREFHLERCRKRKAPAECTCGIWSITHASHDFAP